MPTIATMTEAAGVQIDETMREWLIDLQHEVFDRAVEEIAAEAGLDITEISHRHHPRVDITICIPDRIGSDRWRVRSLLMRAFRLSGWAVDRDKLIIRARLRVLRVKCWPNWDLP